MAAIGLGVSALGGGRGGGKTSVSQSLSNNLGLNFSINPTISAQLGGGVVNPSLSAGVGQSQDSRPTASSAASDAPTSGGFGLPRGNPLGATGSGAGFLPPQAFRQGNDDLLLLVIIGGAAFFLLSGGSK